MPTISLEKYFKSFKSLSGLLTVVGTTVPAIAFFINLSPPFLGKATLLISAAAAAVVIFAYYYEPREQIPNARTNPIFRFFRNFLNLNDKSPQLIKIARKALIASFILLVAYLVLLRICTVPDPRTGEERFQIGFNKYEWSLTEEGRRIKNAHPEASMKDFMMFGRAYSDDRIEVIWMPWTVYLAGVLTIFVFMFTFILWNFGWALIAKQKALSKETQTPPRNG
jgi:hypothetical protein